jgi:phage terminase small subunit
MRPPRGGPRPRHRKSNHGRRGPTSRQRRFVDEYLVDLNGLQAALRAGYSPRSAEHTSRDLLALPWIAEMVAKGMADRAERTRVTQDRVLTELAVLGFSDITHYQVDDAGKLTVTPDAPPGAMRAVASFKQKRRLVPRKDGEPIEEIDTEIRLWDKPAALKLSGQHLGMYVERREHKVEGAGVLAVPVPPDAAQWAATAQAQQALALERPAVSPSPPEAP